ncbi:ABC transporter permease [candidate division KSB1 bacterium]
MKNKKHKPPKIAEWLLNRIVEREEQEFISGDLKEYYMEKRRSAGRINADLWYWSQLIRSSRQFISYIIYWSIVMLKNYLKIAFRNIKKHRIYSFVNISGLAVGLAVCILLIQYIHYELSYDDFHQNADRIYRLTMGDWAGSHGPAGEAAKDFFPEVLDYVKINPIFANGVYSYEDTKFKEEKVFYASSSFLTVFSFNMLQGDPETALEDANTVVLTESTSKRYFGDDDPIGKTIVFAGRQDYEVTGLVEDVPHNSHMKFDMLVSVSSINGDWVNKWYYSSFHTYLLLRPGMDVISLEHKLKDYYKEIEAGLNKDEHSGLNYELQSMNSIHLHSDLRFELEENGDISTVYFLAIITALILLSAWINYINLSTSRALERTREIGIRKVAGAYRSNVIVQFLMEASLFNIIAFIISLILVLFSTPYFSSITGIPDSFPVFYLMEFWLILLSMLVIGVAVSGVYPSLAASSYKTVNILKGKINERTRGNILRKCLLVFQFTVSVALIAGTLTVFNQVRFMMDRDLGMNIDSTLVIKAPGTLRNKTVEERGNTNSVFKTEIGRIPGVQKSASSSFVPGEYVLNIHGGRREYEAKNQEREFHILTVDEDYFDFYNIDILEGRSYSKDFSADRLNLIVNEAALPLLDFENPEQAVGEKVYLENTLFTLVGIAENYHQQSLKYNFTPLLIMNSGVLGGNFSVRLNTQDLMGTINSIKSVWEEVFPQDPFDFFFLDEHFNRQYNTDIKFGQVSGIFTLLAIIIGCMGLFGLASLNVSVRTKEIGIRKTLGASVSGIIAILIRDFVKITIAAVIISAPLSYIYFSNWLDSYAFRIEIGWWFFIVPLVLIAAIVLVTVIFQVLRAAAANPVKSLRYE